jgi:hypothetical protein
MHSPFPKMRCWDGASLSASFTPSTADSLTTSYEAAFYCLARKVQVPFVR